MAGGWILGALRVTLGLDTAEFESGTESADKQIARMERDFKAFGNRMVGLGSKLSIAITAPLILFGKQAFAAASDAAELDSAFSQTFGSMTKEMDAWAVATGDKFGRSTQAMKEMANTFGIFFNQAAPTRKEAAEMSKTFAVLAQDLSSFYNVSESDALQKLRSGLSGESEPLRDFGVFLSEAAVKAKALEMGLKPVGKEFTEQQKILARYALILDKTTNAQGDVLRTADGTANRLRAAQAAWDELQVTIGTKLLPAITPLVDKLAVLLNAFTSLPDGVQSFTVGALALAAALGPLLMGLGGLVSMLSGPIAAAFAEGGWLAAIGAGPVVAGIAALAAAGALIYANWDKIAPVLEAVWEAISTTLGPALEELIGAASDAFTELWNGPLGEALRIAMGIIGELGKVLIDILGPALLLTLKGVIAYFTQVFTVIGDGARLIAALFRGDFSGALDAAWKLVNDMFGGLPQVVVDSTRRLYEGVKTWLQDKLGAVFAWVQGKLEAVGGWFFDLYDRVVGHSYIPDMVDGIAKQMAMLDVVMALPAKKATDVVGQRMKGLAEDVNALLDRLFPAAAALKQFRTEYALLTEAAKAGENGGGLSGSQADAAFRALLSYGGGNDNDSAEVWTGKAIQPMQDIAAGWGDAVDKANAAMDRMHGKAQTTTVTVAKSFADMAQSVVGSLQNLSNSIKGGGFLDILSSVIGLATQLASIGVFGKSAQTTVNKTPAYAGGTSFHPGGLAMVGERGPEIVDLPRGSKVYPNGTGPSGGGSTVQIVPSQYFDAVVDGRIMQAAPGMVSGGAQVAQAQATYRRTRSLRYANGR